MWSKLTDHLSLSEIAAGAQCSERQARRSLAKLADLGIIIHTPGLGAGNLTLVGLPPAEKSGQPVVLFDEAATFAAFPAPRGGYWRDSNWNRRVWQETRAKAGLPDLMFHTLRYFYV